MEKKYRCFTVHIPGAFALQPYETSIFFHWGVKRALRGATPNDLTRLRQTQAGLVTSNFHTPFTHNNLSLKMFSYKSVLCYLYELLSLYTCFQASPLYRLVGITCSGYRRHNDSIQAYSPQGRLLRRRKVF